jgi:predicted histone-like DNA-binding protein
MNKIKYHLIQRGQPGVAGGGEKKFYATISHRERVTLKEFSEEIADGRTLTPTDVMAVLISLSRKIPLHLLKGDIVDLGEMGSFTVNISSAGSADEKEFDQALIRGLNILFRPTPDMKKSLKTASYTKWDGNGTVV